MRWQGGNYSVSWNNNRVASNQNNTLFNPQYTAGFQAIYVQPILANRKIDNTRANLLTTEIQQDISELDLQSTTASIVAQTRNAYWDFVFSILNVENQRASLDLSSKLVQDNRARVEIGTMRISWMRSTFPSTAASNMSTGAPRSSRAFTTSGFML